MFEFFHRRIAIEGDVFAVPALVGGVFLGVFAQGWVIRRKFRQFAVEREHVFAAVADFRDDGYLPEPVRVGQPALFLRSAQFGQRKRLE